MPTIHDYAKARAKVISDSTIITEQRAERYGHPNKTYTMEELRVLYNMKIKRAFNGMSYDDAVDASNYALMIAVGLKEEWEELV